MHRSIQPNTLLGAAGIVMIISFVLAFLIWREAKTPNRVAPPDSAPMSAGPSPSPTVSPPSSATPSASRELDAHGHLHRAIQALRQSSSARDSKRILTELAASLTALPKSDAAKAIQEVLASGLDVPTQLEFEVGEGGRLNGANTFRVFLLDYLGQIDFQAASEVARTILSKPEAPDEWAMCLRNFARANASPESREFLLDRLRVLLANPPWQQNPTTGYLEAFDVAVYLGGAQLVADLTRLLRLTNNPAVSHASFLAVDRLVINDPISVLAVLASDMNLMQGRETIRAGCFARADVSNPEQRRLIEQYLTNPGLKLEELDAFANSFPNENYRISRNLLTTTPPRPGTVIAQRDRATLRVVEEWLQQERFQRVLPHLETTRHRLRQFTRP